MRLTDFLDEIVWNFNEDGGRYTTKLGYLSALTWAPDISTIWQRKFWKMNAPSKEKLHLWLVLNTKALTWDVFQKRYFEGPSMRPLCKCNNETNAHLLFSCGYTKYVRGSLRTKYNVSDLWMEDSYTSSFNRFFMDNTLKAWRPLPFLVCWNIWQ